ncbi:uncharacterized protein F4817DRAFT_147658 [Daldinia loculata]|uniref:uncharacterized protein n=1 Tax=Daldinia loculata TaxID=103429 RepID=UPI0020C2D888|nr:uncharacterized protein F4817DRAFT_147658 [Daldinia loculata]KAI1646424.1 hypothetical protein F4817DRAFT_147658 [Daldinia loculata]
MTSSAPTSTPSSSGCGALLYVIPVQDAACAVPATGNNTDIMGACCGAADVVSYYDGCGLYCLAAGQTVGDLSECIRDKGAAPGNIFCNQNTTATATDTGAPLPTSASASIVVTHSGGSKPTQSGGDGDSDPSSTESPGAAAGLRPEYTTVSTLGCAIVALLFSATAFGALQL